MGNVVPTDRKVCGMAVNLMVQGELRTGGRVDVGPSGICGPGEEGGRGVLVVWEERWGLSVSVELCIFVARGGPCREVGHGVDLSSIAIAFCWKFLLAHLLHQVGTSHCEVSGGGFDWRGCTPV